MCQHKCVQAVLRMEGANIMPFTANNLNIFVSALVASLPNITASDIVIGQVRTCCPPFGGLPDCINEIPYCWLPLWSPWVQQPESRQMGLLEHS